MKNKRRRPSIFLMLAWQDIRQAYRRSKVGPFWLTIGMGIQILTMGLVFGLIFKISLEEYLPFLSTSIVIWALISNSIFDGCMAFISADQIIKQLNIPHYEHVLRAIAKNFITAGHNAILLPLVFLFFSKYPTWHFVALIPGLALLALNLTWIVWILAILSARYRDVPPIVNALVTIAFYVTPIMWYPKQISDGALTHLLLGLNPIYHWIQTVRLPLLGDWPTYENWTACLATAFIGWSITYLLQNRTAKMIPYWV